jgi:predicted RNA-binding Zn ribbon-like protein
MSPAPTLYGTSHQHREAGGRVLRSLEGGTLCLDFINTVSSHNDRPTEDDLSPGYVNLAEWCAGAGAIDEALSTSLLRRASRDPREAAAVRRRAVELRDALHVIVMAIHRGEVPSQEHLDVFSQEWQRSACHTVFRSRLVSEFSARLGERSNGASPWTGVDSRMVRVWDTDRDLDRLLWPIVEDAARLMTSDEMARVRICAASDCERWFLDDSRNHTRKYCSARGCGTVDRVRRFRARHTGESV